ncbi:cyclic nucleotide-binding domain-containing protein [Paraconexibacter sp.]|uniref:cyclic nucleotide-binding domain-containing protein n=1 Tax=Paraconexibacter sp. TaxID=2949640 RepID=UPI003565BE1B
MKDISDLLAESPAFAGLAPELLDTLAGCAINDGFSDGEALLREGEPGEVFYVIRHGAVALETDAATGPLVIETLHEHDVVGWSWLVPPYRSHFRAVARGEVRVLRIDALCLRGKCEQDPVLGRELYRSFAGIITQRLQATRLRLLDVYGPVAST